MPRKKKKARRVDKPKKIRVKPNVKILNTKLEKKKDDISPGRLVAVAVYQGG